MTLRRMRHGLILASLLVPWALASCTQKEAPPPPPSPVAVEQSPTAPPPPPPPPPTIAPTPPPVWRTVRWGMSRNEVLAALPGEAQRLAHPAPFAQPQMGSSLSAGSSDLAIPAYESDGAKFRVLFGFAAKALNRIHMAAMKPGATTCEDVERALTAKVTAPPKRAKIGSSLAGDEVTWKLPDQTIVLTCAGVAALGFQTVTLDYLPPPAESPAP
jgi:hypothetical protein